MTNNVLPDESADIISTLDVLEHVPLNDLADFAHLISRKLKQGGLWLIKVPSTEGLYFLLAHWLLSLSQPFMSGMIKRLWQSEYEFPHTVYFNQRTLRMFVEGQGFQVLDSGYLEEVPNRTVLNRLLMDGAIPKWKALLVMPACYVINLIEKHRRKSDAVFVLARRPQRKNRA
jgi:hypothetical protein